MPSLHFLRRCLTRGLLLTLVGPLTGPLNAAEELNDSDAKHQRVIRAMSLPMQMLGTGCSVDVQYRHARAVSAERYLATIEKPGAEGCLLSVSIAGGRDAVANLVPIAKLGEYGIFGPPGFGAAGQPSLVAALPAVLNHALVQQAMAETGLRLTLGSAAELTQALNAQGNRRVALASLAGGGNRPLSDHQQWEIFRGLDREFSALYGHAILVEEQMGNVDPAPALARYRQKAG